MESDIFACPTGNTISVLEKMKKSRVTRNVYIYISLQKQNVLPSFRSFPKKIPKTALNISPLSSGQGFNNEREREKLYAAGVPAAFLVLPPPFIVLYL